MLYDPRTYPTIRAKRAILFARTSVAVVWLLAIAMTCWILAGCNGSPTEPEYRSSCESGCTDSAPVPLSALETYDWIQRARDEVQAQADRGEIRLSKPLSAIPDPPVDWRPCPWMTRGYDTPGGPVKNVCAAGQTESDGSVIRVSTWERSRRGPLVQHEARNAFYIKTGNVRLTYERRTDALHS